MVRFRKTASEGIYADMTETITAPCRICKKDTKQLERIVTHNLPPNVKVLQCCKCEAMGVVLIESADA